MQPSRFLEDSEILRRTSRTFALSIQALPRALREPVEVAYLLARAADTLADSGMLEDHRRAEMIRALREAVESAPESGSPANPTAVSPKLDGGDDPVQQAEAELLVRLDALLARLRAMDPGDRQDVAWVVAVLARTMERELDHFDRCPGPVAWPDAAALTAYTEGIAGCVGEFWTRLIQRHLGFFSADEYRAMCIEGRRFGRALQLINVVRDLPRDLRRGRCFLPADELAEESLEPADLLDPASSTALAPILRRWEQRAYRGALAGVHYTSRLPRRSWGLRVATLLPATIGLDTLRLLRASARRLDPHHVIKVPRSRIRRRVASAMLLSLFRKGPFYLV